LSTHAADSESAVVKENYNGTDMTRQIQSATQAVRHGRIRPRNIVAARMTVATSSILAALCLTGCDVQTNRQISALMSNAKGVATNLIVESDVGLINGEPDYGIKFSLQVQNVGDAGPITILPSVSSSEGEWQREQKVQFAAGETRTLSYFFHEPTINASNVQGVVKLYPGPGK
jgi:hypothetical protein